jgi:D-alanine--poly(phosphoribitol) ligase subunit 1
VNDQRREADGVSGPTYPNLALPFYRHACSRPERPALWVGGVGYSYAELSRLAGSIAGWLSSGECQQVARVAILTSRSLEAYAGVLGTAWAGAAYVPLNPQLPPLRIAKILELSRVDALIVDKAGLARLSPEVLAHAPQRILAPGLATAGRLGQAHVSGADAIPSDTRFVPMPRSEDDMAYLMFTSGTTGVPKGVMVTNGNVMAVLAALQTRYPMGSEDRVSQSFELSFDLSVADIFWTWGTGASLHVVPGTEVMAPDNFIRERSLTVWASTPSTIAMLNRMRRLKVGIFPSLRYSWFCGEALPLASALAWRQAAPGSIVDNHYGPTEATVACMGYRFSVPAVVTPERQILSIGSPFPGTDAKIVTPSLGFLAPGAVGELALSGCQLATGYLDDPTKTAARFPVIGGCRWYLTGDLAYQDASGMFHHLGRADNQVKVLGHRVELEEVEAHLREACGAGMTAAVAWPLEQQAARGLVGFVCDTALPIADIREAMRERVPPYMVPARIVLLERFPLTTNGKVDRKALLKMLDAQAETQTSLA